jgi:hypothetical protein
MDAVTLLREQVRWAHEALERALEGAGKEELHWLPPGDAAPVGALYAGAIIAEDAFVNALLKGGKPLFATTFDDRVGVSDCMPLPGAIWDDFQWPVYSWGEWARRVRVSFPMIQKYKRAVHGSTDAYLSALSPDDFSRAIDLSRMGHNEVAVAWVVSHMLIGRAYEASAEINRIRDLYAQT